MCRRGRGHILLDGRRTSPVGAAWANAVLANVLDYDDGHRLTKGHPGAMIVPGLLALAEARDARVVELLEAIVVGYEIAVRAGVELHRRDSAYHASGAWGALGVAAAAARLLGLDRTATRHALGLAEYHGPIAPIMRSCADPAMTKDACDLGARIGVESALLAQGGYTGCASFLLDGLAPDLGTRWPIDENYLKDHPCCRWSQGGIRAALELHGPDPATVERIEVRTFAAADGLSKGVPATPRRRSTTSSGRSPRRSRPGASAWRRHSARSTTPRPATVGAREVVVDPALDAHFPAQRLTAVEVTTGAGVLVAGPCEARGEPDDPDWEEIALAKVRSLIGPSRPSGGTTHSADGGPDGLAGIGLDRLVGLLAPADAPAR